MRATKITVIAAAIVFAAGTAFAQSSSTKSGSSEGTINPGDGSAAVGAPGTVNSGTGSASAPIAQPTAPATTGSGSGVGGASGMSGSSGLSGSGFGGAGGSGAGGGGVGGGGH